MAAPFEVATPTAPPGDLLVHPARFRAWVDALNYAAHFESGRHLLGHARALAGTKIEADTRLELLEHHARAAARALPALEAFYALSGPPLDPAARSAVGLVRDYTTALIAGYKRVAADLGGKLLGSRGAAKALRRAMHFASLRMIASYQSYTPVAPGAWADLHQVYLRAEEARVVTDADPGTKRSILDEYTEVLLLSLSDPYRLAAGQLQRLREEAQRLSPPVTLHRTRTEGAIRGQYLVSCDTDRPPKPALSAHEDTGGPNWRLLDPAPALRHVQAAIAAQKPLGAGGRALFEKVVRLWSDPPQRTMPRDLTEGTAAICSGLEPVGQLIAVESRADLLAQDKALRSGITMPLLAVLAADDSGPLPVYEWEVLNQSAGGLRVRRTGGPQTVGVGEVVAIRLPGKPLWSIGAARWITLYDSGGMEFGLQFVAESARTVRVSDHSGFSKAGLYFEACDGEPAKLLVPPDTFGERKQFELAHDEGQFLVRAGKMRERTARFELFEVSLE